jgi:hypothetical protein
LPEENRKIISGKIILPEENRKIISGKIILLPAAAVGRQGTREE